MVMEDVLVDRCAATSLGPCDSNELHSTHSSELHVLSMLWPQWEVCHGGTKQECMLTGHPASHKSMPSYLVPCSMMHP